MGERMNYSKIYNALCERGRTRTLASYKELHHIVPKCIGGTNTTSNLTSLTAKEHFIAHRLLVKIYQNNRGLTYALWMMAMGGENIDKIERQYRITSRLYESLRLQLRSFPSPLKGRKQSAAHIESRRLRQLGVSTSLKGQKQSPEHIAKRVAKMTGFAQSQHQRDTISKVFAKTYRMTSPSGEVMIVTNLRRFCMERHLGYSNFASVASGRLQHSLGWLCTRIDTPRSI